ncbi:hypothetical protein GCM10027189_29940 [Rufibacter soli]
MGGSREVSHKIANWRKERKLRGRNDWAMARAVGYRPPLVYLPTEKDSWFPGVAHVLFRPDLSAAQQIDVKKRPLANRSYWSYFNASTPYRKNEE